MLLLIVFVILINSASTYATEDCNPVPCMLVNNNNSILRQHSCCKKNKGKELVACILAHQNNDKKDYLLKLSPAKRHELLQNMNLDEYKKFLDTYSQERWCDLYQHLTQEEQEYWPKTLNEQRCAIDAIEQTAQKYRNSIGMLISGALACVTLISPVLEIVYVMRNNVHPITQYALAHGFRRYKEQQFRV